MCKTSNCLAIYHPKRPRSDIFQQYFHALRFKMSETDKLYETFSAFCNFGAGKNGSLFDITGGLMDGTKWAKFCRDNQL